jgi:HPt (histidine-containing phosphotransfer) domain-containing protein
MEQQTSMLSSFNFLDTEIGMLNCMNDEKFYLKILKEFVKSQKDKELQDCFDREDWKNYHIHVHALKGTALTIGAVALSEKAKELEMQIKQGNTDYIKQHHSEIMEPYAVLVDKMQKTIDSVQTAQ